MVSVLTKNFSLILNNLAESLDISPTAYEEAEDRYKAVGKHLNRDDSIVSKYKPDISPQGSFAIGTVTKTLTENDDIDIDLIACLEASKASISQKDLKTLIGYEIIQYAKINKMKFPTEEHRRCWRLNYSEGSKFHMDILPAIPDKETMKYMLEAKGYKSIWSEYAIAITDNMLNNYNIVNPDWPVSNPKGYKEWFKERMKVQYDKQLFNLSEKIQKSVEKIPEYKIKTPLQKAIQILKRHRDIMFVNDKDHQPISIIISTLAGHAYNNEADTFEALLNIITKMPDFIFRKEGILWVPNPVNPLENFADKWPENKEKEHNFMRWLRQVYTDLSEASIKKDNDSLNESLRFKFGSKPVFEAIKKSNNHNDTSQLFFAVKPGLIKNTIITPAKFDVPHRRNPQWPVVQTNQVRVSAKYTRNGYRPRDLVNDDIPVPMGGSLRFEAKTDYPHSYKVYWQIVNTGYQADLANNLRGGFYEGFFERGGLVKEEDTKYKGMHWVECFIVNKSNICVARSGEFIVNII